MREVCPFDITPIYEKIVPYDNVKWDDWVRRRGGYHEHSRSIPLKWTENLNGFNPEETNKFNQIKFFLDYSRFGNELDDINNAIDKVDGAGKLINALFIKLFAGGIIKDHNDNPSNNNDNLFVKTRRYHIPIVTLPKVVMRHDDNEYHLKAGYIYELDNATGLHGVRNDSPVDRIHLVIDRCPFLLDKN